MDQRPRVERSAERHRFSGERDDAPVLERLLRLHRLRDLLARRRRTRGPVRRRRRRRLLRPRRSRWPRPTDNSLSRRGAGEPRICGRHRLGCRQHAQHQPTPSGERDYGHGRHAGCAGSGARCRCDERQQPGGGGSCRGLRRRCPIGTELRRHGRSQLQRCHSRQLRCTGPDCWRFPERR